MTGTILTHMLAAWLGGVLALLFASLFVINSLPPKRPPETRED